MKTRIVLATLCGLLVIMSGTGCESARKRTKLDRNKTGLFSDNREVLAEKFKTIVQGKTTAEELRAMGFNFSAPNVQTFTGVPAFRELFGQEVFRNIEANGFDKRLPEYNRYTLYQIPYKDTLTTSDRIYLNKMKTTTVGWDALYSVVLHNDVVVYAAPKEVFLDQLLTDRRLFGGPIDLIRELGGAIGLIR